MNHCIKVYIATMIIGATPALAESSLSLGVTSASVTYEGDSYSGIIGYGVAGSFDITDNVYASGSIAMITVDGSSISAFDAGIGYLFENSLDADSGSGSRIGVSASLGGGVSAGGEFAVSQGVIASGSLSTTLQSFGSTFSYAVGVEYEPWGIFVGYENASISGYDMTVQGFTVGTKLRF